MDLLVLSAWSPFPADNGSKIRTHHLLRALCAKHTVDLACFFQNPREKAALQQAQEICRDTAFFPKPPFDAAQWPGLKDLLSPLPRFVRTSISPEMKQTIAEWRTSKRYDAVVCMTWGMTPYLAGTTQHDKVILDQHNIESGIFRRGLRRKRGLNRVRGWMTYQKFRRFEGRTCAGFDACSVVSDREVEELRRILPAGAAAKIATIPNGVDIKRLGGRLASCRADYFKRAGLLFTGDISYGANADALQWLLSEIYPHIKAALPQVTLYITGDSNASEMAKRCTADSVIFTGYQQDLRPLLWGSAALIVPLRTGGGTRLKILEAMAAGLPVISTAVGAEGIAAEPQQHFLLADNAAEFVKAARQVITQPLRTMAMTGRARKLVERKYDWEQIGRRFVSLVEGVAA